MKQFILVLTISFIGLSGVFAQKKVFDNELYLGVGAGAFTSSIDFVPNIPR